MGRREWGKGKGEEGGGISSERDVERLNAVLTGIFPVSGLTDGAATVPRPQHVMVIGSSVLGDLDYRSARVERFSDVSQIQFSQVIAGAMKHQLQSPASGLIVWSSKGAEARQMRLDHLLAWDGCGPTPFRGGHSNQFSMRGACVLLWICVSGPNGTVRPTRCRWGPNTTKGWSSSSPRCCHGCLRESLSCSAASRSRCTTV